MRKVLLYVAGQSSFGDLSLDHFRSMYDVVLARNLEMMISFLSSFIYDNAVVDLSIIYTSDNAFTNRLRLLRERVSGNVVITFGEDVDLGVENKISEEKIRFLRKDYSINELEHALGKK